MTTPSDRNSAYSEELAAAFSTAWQQLEDEQHAIIAGWPTWTVTERRQALDDFTALVDRLKTELDEQAAAWVPTLSDVYAAGATTAVPGATLTATDVDAVAAMQDQLLTDLLAATTRTSLTVKQLIRTLSREHLRDRIEGNRTAVQAGRDLAAELNAQGVYAVTYANGARVGLDTYAQMLLRTETALAFQQGGFASIERSGTLYVELFDGPFCGLRAHDDPEKANGLILPLSEARQWPIAHPNCVRVSSPRPDVHTAEEAASASPSTTYAQRQDAVHVAADRSRLRARSARLAARRARLDKRNAGGA